nr:MAG TPA: hypothetical protein [Caudoviricetes sp.]
MVVHLIMYFHVIDMLVLIVLAEHHCSPLSQCGDQ